MSVQPAFAQRTLVGEALVGSGPDAAHINVAIGRKGGPVETAWLTALATPRQGHVPLLVTLRPNLPVKPMTLFVNSAEVRGERHEALTRGAALAGVAGGIARALAEGILPVADADDLLIIAAVWVDWTAEGEDEVYANNLAATYEAVQAAIAGLPPVADVVAEAGHPWNASFHKHRN